VPTRIVVGNEILRLEAEAEDPVDPKWVFGRFRLWVRGEPLGDWDDTVTLRAVASCWRSFVDDAQVRWDERLAAQAPDEMVRLLIASAFDEICGAVPDAYGRFVISHLGMSAFDALRVVVIDHPDGRQIIGWEAVGMFANAELPQQSLERVGREFIDAYDAAGLPL
jgi:hypothetical protein